MLAKVMSELWTNVARKENKLRVNGSATLTLKSRETTFLKYANNAEEGVGEMISKIFGFRDLVNFWGETVSEEHEVVRCVLYNELSRMCLRFGLPLLSVLPLSMEPLKNGVTRS